MLTAGWKSSTESCALSPVPALRRRLTPGPCSTIAELQTDLNTNLFGVINATHALLPLLRAGQQKKIWTVSSLVGSIGGPISDGPAAAMCASES